MVPRDGGTGELAYQAPKASPCLSKSAFFQKIGVYFFGNEIIPVGRGLPFVAGFECVFFFELVGLFPAQLDVDIIRFHRD